MKIDKSLMKAYRRNPSEFRDQFKELRLRGADKECIKCNLVPAYLPKSSKYLALGGIGAILLSSAIKGINHLLGGDPNINFYCQTANLGGLITILGAGTFGPAESLIRRGMGPRVKPFDITREVAEFINLAHITATANYIEESLNPLSRDRDQSNPYSYINISLEDKENPYIRK